MRTSATLFLERAPLFFGGPRVGKKNLERGRMSSDPLCGADVLNLYSDDVEHLIGEEICADVESRALLHDLLATSHDVIGTVVDDLASGECPVDLEMRSSRKRRRSRLVTLKRKRARKSTLATCSPHVASPLDSAGA